MRTYQSIINNIFFNYTLLDRDQNLITKVIQYTPDGEQSEIDAIKQYGQSNVLELRYLSSGESYIILDIKKGEDCSL